MIYYLNATIESQGISVAVVGRYIVQMGGTWSKVHVLHLLPSMGSKHFWNLVGKS